MRAVSLSNNQVISLLNRYFVPVFVSNADFAEGGSASPAAKAELRRIFQEGYAQKLSVGTVHAYVVAPDGHLLDSMHTAQVAKPELLVAMLERAVQRLGTPPGEPVVPPAPPAPPSGAPGSLRLHVVARYLERKGNALVPVENAGGNWSALPGEDWLVLSRAEWTKWLPPGTAAVGMSWDIDPAAAAMLLKRFYPPTEENDLSNSRIEHQSLRATVISVRNGVARARLEGSLRMKHPFYHKDDGNFVEATVAGYLDFDLAKRQIRALRLVTDGATYGAAGRQLPFGAAAREAE